MELKNTFPTNYSNILPKTIRVISNTILILSPWILLFIVTEVIAHKSVTLSTPCWNDELSYWHEILSFSSKGFDFGYYSMNEMIPKYLSFGTHGFGSVSIYSAYAKIFGWNFNSIVIANNVFLSMAFLILVLVTKPTIKKSLFISLFYLTYTPLILYCSTSMTELLNFAIMVLYITLLYSSIKTKDYKNKMIFVLFLFCFFVSFIRIIYIILFLPIYFLKNKDVKFNLKLFSFLIGWIFLSLVLFLFNSQFVSLFPYSFLNELFSQSNLLDFVLSFVKHFFLNMLRLIYPLRDDFIQVFQRYIVVSFTIWLFIKSRVIKTQTKQFNTLYFSAFMLLCLSLLITIVAYDVFDWRDYRVISPFIFGVVLLLTLFDKYLTIKSFLYINALGLLILILSPSINKSFFFDENRYSTPLSNLVLNEIKYTDNASNKFENTVVVESYDKSVFLNTPSGVGISHSDLISDKLKSKYIYTHKFLKLKTYQKVKVCGNDILYQKILNK